MNMDISVHPKADDTIDVTEANGSRMTLTLDDLRATDSSTSPSIAEGSPKLEGADALHFVNEGRR